MPEFFTLGTFCTVLLSLLKNFFEEAPSTGASPPEFSLDTESVGILLHYLKPTALRTRSSI